MLVSLLIQKKESNQLLEEMLLPAETENNLSELVTIITWSL